MDIPKGLIDQIASDKCVVLVGAGLSQGAGLPGWPQLLRQMIEWSAQHGVDVSDRAELEHLIENNDLLTMAQEMRERMGKEKFRDFMAGVFRQALLRPTEAHLLLPKIPFTAALTTNYDKLLESAFTIACNGTSPHVFTHDDTAELSASLNSGEFYILKLHGTIDQIETIILGRQDYRALIHQNISYWDHLKILFSTRTVLFIGFGLADPDLLLLLEEMKAAFADYTTTHYALADAREMSAIKQKRLAKDYGIEIIPYTPTEDDHPEVRLFLQELIDKHLSAKTILKKLEKAGKVLNDIDPHVRVVATTKGELLFEEKYPGALEEHPQKISAEFSFDTNTPEGREEHERFNRHLATGEPVTVKSPHLKSFVLPEIMQRFANISEEGMQLKIGSRRSPKKMPVKIEIESNKGERATLNYIELQVTQDGYEETTLDNQEQSVPFKVRIVFNRKNYTFTFSFNLDDGGINVKEELDGLRFLQALAGGGTFSVESLQTGLSLVKQQIPPGIYKEIDPFWIETFEKLVFIQNKVPVLLNIPQDDITVEEAERVFTVAHILETGHAEITIKPWVTNSKLEQARAVWDAFKDGQIQKIHLNVQAESSIRILGVDVPLGSVLITCERTHITKKDLKALKKAIETSAPGDVIHVQLTPYKRCSGDARYLKWLPEEEAAEVRRIPFIRIREIEGILRVMYENKKREGDFDVDGFIDHIVEAQAKESAQAGSSYPVEPWTAEEFRAALESIVRELNPETRFKLAAKLFERGLLSSGKASRLIGMDRVTFLMDLHKVGVAVIDLDEEQLESQARYVNSQ